MSDVQQIKAGQRGKTLQFVTGTNLAAASSITIRLRGTDGVLRTYPGAVSPTDPTVIELVIGAAMFDTPDTVAVDYIVLLSDGRVLSPDENIMIEVIDL